MFEAPHKQALYELVCRYAQAVNQRDRTALSRLFTPDAVLEGPGVSFSGMIVDLHGLGRDSRTQHHMHNYLTEVDEQQAGAETYCVANHLCETRALPTSSTGDIRYNDRFVCTDGPWRASHRELLFDWSHDLPLQQAGAR